MVTIILAIALLIALLGLGLEIGIASWSIRRAHQYRNRESAALRTSEQAISERENIEERMKSLDNYAAKLSWLLNFLYNRYDKFTDLEKEVNEGLKEVSGDTPIGEADDKYTDLKKALNLIKITIRAPEQMENLMDTISTQLGRIAEDLRDEGEETEPGISQEAKPTANETASPETPDTNAPEGTQA